MLNETNSFKILFVKSEGKKPLGKPRHRWEDNTNGFLEKNGMAWTRFMWIRIKVISRYCGEGCVFRKLLRIS